MNVYDSEADARARARLAVQADQGETIRRRHWKCRCEIACRRFKCTAPHHRGSRSTPWCDGGADGIQIDEHSFVDTGNWCSTCFATECRRRERARAKEKTT